MLQDFDTTISIASECATDDQCSKEGTGCQSASAQKQVADKHTGAVREKDGQLKYAGNESTFGFFEQWQSQQAAQSQAQSQSPGDVVICDQLAFPANMALVIRLCCNANARVLITHSYIKNPAMREKYRQKYLISPPPYDVSCMPMTGAVFHQRGTRGVQHEER